MTSFYSIRNTRLDALCDGVFSIVLTLLVLELKLPEGSTPQDLAEVITELKHLLPSLYSYLISFFVIASYWELHHKLTAEFLSCTPELAKKTFKFLLCISLIPFSSLMQLRYGDTFIGFSIYCFNLAICGVTMLNIWFYVKNNLAILVAEESEKLWPFFSRKLLIITLIFLLGSLLSFYNLKWAHNVCLLFFIVAPIHNLFEKIYSYWEEV